MPSTSSNPRPRPRGRLRWTPSFGPQRRVAKVEPASSLYASYNLLVEVSFTSQVGAVCMSSPSVKASQRRGSARGRLATWGQDCGRLWRIGFTRPPVEAHDGGTPPASGSRAPGGAARRCRSPSTVRCQRERRACHRTRGGRPPRTFARIVAVLGDFLAFEIRPDAEHPEIQNEGHAVRRRSLPSGLPSSREAVR